MVNADDLEVLRLEIRIIPHREYNHAARALELAQKILCERDRALEFVKEILLEMGLPEKEAAGQISRRMGAE